MQLFQVAPIALFGIQQHLQLPILQQYLKEKELIQLEYSGFDGATVPICTFTLENAHNPNFKGGYVRLSDFRGADQQGPRALEIIQAANQMGK